MKVATLVASALAAALAACSSPNPVLYTIAPVSGAVQSGGPKVVALQQISTARFLERSQIVRSSENYRLDVMSNDWWGEPLGAMVSRVLVEELGHRRERCRDGRTGCNDRAQPAAARRGCCRQSDPAGSGKRQLQGPRAPGIAQLPLHRDPAGPGYPGRGHGDQQRRRPACRRARRDAAAALMRSRVDR